MEIETNKVADDSLIYLTPTTKPNGQILYIKEINDGQNFVVAIEKSEDKDSTISLDNGATSASEKTL